MIINLSFGTNDLEKAGKFYDAIAAELGCGCSNQTEKAIFWASPGVGIGFAVTKPYNGEPACFGNGVMATIGAKDRAQVDRIYAAKWR